ncbi:MAG: hypothetical protein J6C99_07750 [Lachnospiraceae bacterium]|nr:hypothetical protein [Lachnospiraceae bacterium]
MDRYLIYARILEIRLFVPEYAIDYTGVDSLLEEYDSFCNTGRNSKILDEFHKDCELAAAQVSEKGIQFDDIVNMMAWLGKGKLKIENGGKCGDFLKFTLDKRSLHNRYNIMLISDFTVICDDCGRKYRISSDSLGVDYDEICSKKHRWEISAGIKSVV